MYTVKTRKENGRKNSHIARASQYVLGRKSCAGLISSAAFSRLWSAFRSRVRASSAQIATAETLIGRNIATHARVQCVLAKIINNALSKTKTHATVSFLLLQHRIYDLKYYQSLFPIINSENIKILI